MTTKARVCFPDADGISESCEVQVRYTQSGE